ncbi:MAG TPA: hypothetical protein VJN90_09165, partial [Candidatus Acidoferrales bacterium]|nr:hypothetical protein [Candidatus Acidoferrales bacterium]
MASAATRKGVLGVVLSGMGMLVCGGALAMQTLRVQNDIAKDKAKYERETNPIGRAKALTKLGRAEYLAARQS